ncbi:MAG: hypothetical protein ABSB40_04995 [Nitrososphaeria archaeon]|jgi:hypothetical protein
MTTSNDRLLHNCRHILTPTCQHILTKGKDICERERWPFTHLDFPEVNYGTFRNSVSYLLKSELLEDYTSHLAFYWVVGVKKPNDGWGNMKSYGMGVQGRKKELIDLIERTPLEDRCIHDIRLWFRKDGIYSIIAGSEVVNKIAPQSKDLILETIDIDLFRTAKILIHANDSVSICLGCSLKPFPETIPGYTDFVYTLGSLARCIEEWSDGKIRIPSVCSWKIKGRHIGRDSVTEYSGERFNITVSKLGETLRTYSKIMQGRNKIRIERIEEPDLDIASVMRKRLCEDSQ